MEVTIRRPVRLEHGFRVGRLGRDGVTLLDGDEVVAEATPARVELAVPPAPDFDAAVAAGAGFRGATHHNPGCFGCGPERGAGDGLGLRPGPCPGFAGVVSAWVPLVDGVRPGGAVPTEWVWAALDCPGAYALAHPTMVLLGRIAARVDRVPRNGERLRTLGWALGREGRKLHVGTAIVDADDVPIAVSRGTWIELRSGVWERMRG